MPSRFEQVPSAKHGLWDASPEDRIAYYAHVCESYGLYPSTIPFQWYDLPARIDEAYSMAPDAEEITLLRPRCLELYGNSSFVDQVTAKHRIEIDQIVITEDTEHTSRCQVRLSAPNFPASTGYNGFWISQSPREARNNALHTAVASVAFSLSKGSAYVEHENATLLIPGVRRVTMDMRTGEVITKQTLPSIFDELQAQIEADGRYTWSQFQLMVDDMPLDIIEDDIEAARWDAYVPPPFCGQRRCNPCQ